MVKYIILTIATLIFFGGCEQSDRAYKNTIWTRGYIEYLRKKPNEFLTYEESIIVKELFNPDRTDKNK